ncbi:MAG: GNAT family N-acetyltransferase [Bacteroidales bacterium]|nr:GNAT family N-acetyltransferase [Bacteroidales bacterium]
MNDNKITLHSIDRNHLDATKLLEIYEKSFPESERIASTLYYDMLEEYAIDIYGIYEDTTLVGLVNMMPRQHNGITYIWFLAIAENFRDKGIGGKAIELLKPLYPNCQFVLDMEPLDPLSENYQERLRRTRFYERHGFVRTGRGMKYFGQSFEIMCTNPPFREADFRKHYVEPAFVEWNPEFFDITLPQ